MKLSFESVSVAIPVVNETHSLRHVVDTILNNSGSDIRELIFVVCSKTTADSLAICREFEKKLPYPVKIHIQKLPYLGGAIREAFELAGGSHVLIMFSDGESDPATVPDLITASKQSPEAIVCASRWLKGGGFENYHPLKFLYNYIAQKLFAWLYQTKATDLTFGFRIYPVRLAQSFAWEETGHPFVFESILKPIRLKIPVVEIPTVWRARNEGESQLVPFAYLKYLWVGIKYRIHAPYWLHPEHASLAEEQADSTIAKTDG